MNQYYYTFDRVRFDQCYIVQNLLINHHDRFRLNHFNFFRSKEIRFD